MTVKYAEVAALVDRIMPILAGWPREAQGFALADCLALWLAGHHVAGDVEATRKLRDDLLAMHSVKVRKLTAINAMEMGMPY